MTINQFAKKLATIHNENGLLYSDMLDQDTLFKVQDDIIELLLEAHREGSISKNTLVQFNHIFTIK